MIARRSIMKCSSQFASSLSQEWPKLLIKCTRKHLVRPKCESYFSIFFRFLLQLVVRALVEAWEPVLGIRLQTASDLQLLKLDWWLVASPGHYQSNYFSCNWPMVLWLQHLLDNKLRKPCWSLLYWQKARSLWQKSIFCAYSCAQRSSTSYLAK